MDKKKFGNGNFTLRDEPPTSCPFEFNDNLLLSELKRNIAGTVE